MLYMNGMEIDMINRLLQKYKLVNLGKIVEYDFYHLEHCHPWVPRKSSTYRKTNSDDNVGFKACFHPNNLSLSPPSTNSIAAISQRKWRARDRARFALLSLFLKAQIAWDALVRSCIKLVDTENRWMVHGEREAR